MIILDGRDQDLFILFIYFIYLFIYLLFTYIYLSIYVSVYLFIYSFTYSRFYFQTKVNAMLTFDLFTVSPHVSIHLCQSLLSLSLFLSSLCSPSRTSPPGMDSRCGGRGCLHSDTRERERENVGTT